MYERAALRFFWRAVEAAPGESAAALAHLESRFPSQPESPQTRRLLERYLETGFVAVTSHQARVAAAWEAQISQHPPEDEPVAVVGGIVPPRRTGGPKVRFSAVDSKRIRRRLNVAFEVTPSGETRNIAVLDGVNARQDAAVVAALEQWTFEPARLPDGRPIAVFWLSVVNAAPDSPSPGPGR